MDSAPDYECVGDLARVLHSCVYVRAECSAAIIVGGLSLSGPRYREKVLHATAIRPPTKHIPINLLDYSTLIKFKERIFRVIYHSNQNRHLLLFSHNLAVYYFLYIPIYTIFIFMPI